MIDRLLKRCRNRALIGLALQQFSWVAILVLGFSSLVLLLGSPALDWWIPLSVGCAGAAYASWRTHKCVPGLLTTAVTLDRACHLSDALSTAHHFRSSSSPLHLAQRAEAETSLPAIDPRTVFPLVFPRSGYVLVAGTLLVLALGISRYGSSKALPGPSHRAGALASAGNAGTIESKVAGRKRLDDLIQRLGLPAEDTMNLVSGSGQTTTAGAKPFSKEGTSASSESSRPEGEASTDSSGTAAGGSKGSERPGNSPDGSQRSAQAAGKQPNSQAGSGLMSKLKDAVSSLMSKMKPPSSPPNGQNGSQKGSQEASTQQPNGQKGGNPSDRKNAEKSGSEKSDGEPDAGSDTDQAAPGSGTGKSEQAAAAKPGSGTGTQEGSKEIQNAEQEAALGKLSEIIGKRSKNVSGEMAVESESGAQQLSTVYSKSSARHRAAGGDISRDEVPLPLQSYVQKYYDQVRKQAPRPEAAQKGRATR